MILVGERDPVNPMVVVVGEYLREERGEVRVFNLIGRELEPDVELLMVAANVV